jgi:hypothetical protein
MISRETVRDAFYALLDTELQGPPKLAEVVCNYQLANFQGRSPIVMIYGGGAFRPRATVVGGKSEFRLWIALYVSHHSEGSYTELDAEDRLDALEQAVAEVVHANFQTELWNALRYELSSVIEAVNVSGIVYLREMVPLLVEVFG